MISGKVILITGSYPPDVCGVGDYSSLLIQSNSASSWQLYYKKSWGMFSFFEHLVSLLKKNPKNIVLQYPTQGYGWSLIPHLLCIYFSLFTKVRFIVCLHEFSQLSFKARIANTIFLMSANYLVFTNEFERKFCSNLIKRVWKKSSVIKIMSNIECVSELNIKSQRNVDVMYFGHIRPNKGIEVFLEVIRNLSLSMDGLSFVILGQVPVGFEDYFFNLKNSSLSLKIDWVINASNQEVSSMLNNAKTVCLPFPDGVSERRGTMMASLANGSIVCTLSGNYTTDALRKVLLVADSKDLLSSKVLAALTLSDEQYSSMQREGLEFLRIEFPVSWDEIAESYNRFNA